MRRPASGFTRFSKSVTGKGRAGGQRHPHLKDAQSRFNHQHEYLPNPANIMQKYGSQLVMPHSKIPLLSFFSGAGFLDIGFLREDFDILWHNECHDPFAAAYETGVSALGYNTASNKIQNRKKVQDLTPKIILEEAFGGSRPDSFGIIGGPPCPDFSRGGKNKGRNGANGKLTRNFVGKIAKLKPVFFLMENVPGLLETRKHREFLFSMLGSLSKDFAVDIKVLNALEYGVPQDRRRVFVVGFNRKWLRQSYAEQYKDIASKSNAVVDWIMADGRTVFDQKHPHWFCWPKPLYPGIKVAFRWPTVVNGGTPRMPKNCPKELTVGYHFKSVHGHPNSGDSFNPKSRKFTTIKEGDTSGKSFKRLHRFRFSPNAAYGNNEVHMHPTKNRRLTVAEALAIQSVPREYHFPPEITLTNKFKAVGNGVPVKLSQAVASSIAKFIQRGRP